MKKPDEHVSVWLACCMSVLLVCFAISSTAVASPGSTRSDQLLKRVMKTDGLPSISVAVSRRHEIVYTGAFGYADREKRVATTAASSYAIGSISKSITAVAALQLAERNKLDLDAPVQTYCPEFPVKSNPITVRQLLGHTSGIRHYDYRRFDEDFMNKRHFKSLGEALSKFANDPLIADPGTKYAYSSWGFVLVGCAIEGASGQSYDAYLRSEIVEPLGLSSIKLDVTGESEPNRAFGYYTAQSGAVEKAGFFDASDRYPAGGLLGTPTDLVRFGNALLAGKLLGDESRREMWSSAILNSKSVTGHGLGWNLSKDGKSISHGGTTVGTTTYLYVRPDQEIVVAIAVNLSRWSRDRDQLASQLADLFLLPDGK